MFSEEPKFIDPPLWGNHFWVSIESVILAMDTKEKNSVDSVYMFLMSLQNTLPCPTCRGHYQEYCKKYKVEECIYDKNLLLGWIYRLQKEIQERNGKTMIEYSSYIETLKEKFQLS